MTSNPNSRAVASSPRTLVRGAPNLTPSWHEFWSRRRESELRDVRCDGCAQSCAARPSYQTSLYPSPLISLPNERNWFACVGKYDTGWIDANIENLLNLGL